MKKIKLGEPIVHKRTPDSKQNERINKGEIISVNSTAHLSNAGIKFTEVTDEVKSESKYKNSFQKESK